MAATNKRRYTSFFITVNTNHKPRTAEAEHLLKQRVKAFFENNLLNREMFGDLMSFSPDISILDHVHLSAAAVELGPKTGFVHGHAVLIIEHHGVIKQKKQGSQAALQRAFQQAVGSRGAYANFQLHNSMLLNYTAKTTGDATELASGGMQEEVSF